MARRTYRVADGVCPTPYYRAALGASAVDVCGTSAIQSSGQCAKGCVKCLDKFAGNQGEIAKGGECTCLPFLGTTTDSLARPPTAIPSARCFKEEGATHSESHFSHTVTRMHLSVFPTHTHACGLCG
eukprot:58804-Chlamydomonas_euryale.AAC.1